MTVSCTLFCHPGHNGRLAGSAPMSRTALADERGRVHLADKPLDARYRLFQARRARCRRPATATRRPRASGRYLDALDQTGGAEQRLTPLIRTNRSAATNWSPPLLRPR